MAINPNQVAVQQCPDCLFTDKQEADHSECSGRMNLTTAGAAASKAESAKSMKKLTRSGNSTPPGGFERRGVISRKRYEHGII